MDYFLINLCESIVLCVIIVLPEYHISTNQDGTPICPFFLFLTVLIFKREDTWGM